MPAKIIIAEGPLAGGELWVEYEVVRLGSDSGCELQIDDAAVDAHAATIRYADRRYTVYNRSRAPLQIDALVVAPGESGVWRSGTSLFFGGGTVLTLETSGDGAPARRAVLPTAAPSMLSNVVADDAAITTAGAAEPQDVEAKKKADNKAAIVGMVFVVAVLGIILTSDDAGAPTAGGKPVPTFAELMPRLKGTPEIAPDLWVRLSETYAAAYRGDTATAQREYRLLRDRIDWEKNSLLSRRQPIPDALLDAELFVKSKM